MRPVGDHGWPPSTGIVLAQVTAAAKSNEIPAFAPVLDSVATVLGSLAGVLFIVDALHTQTANADELAARRLSDDPGQTKPAQPVQPAQSPILGSGSDREGTGVTPRRVILAGCESPRFTRTR